MTVHARRNGRKAIVFNLSLVFGFVFEDPVLNFGPSVYRKVRAGYAGDGFAPSLIQELTLRPSRLSALMSILVPTSFRFRSRYQSCSDPKWSSGSQIVEPARKWEICEWTILSCSCQARRGIAVALKVETSGAPFAHAS